MTRTLTWSLSALVAPFGLALSQSAPDFPAAVRAETRRLEFLTAALTTEATSHEQSRHAVRDLLDRHGTSRIVKLRVIALTHEDLVDAETVIRDTFKSAGKPLPALALLRAEGFPDSSQRIAIEATAVSDRTVNPNGLTFLAGLASPTIERTIAGLKRVLAASGATAERVVRVSCFYETPSQVIGAREAVRQAFPSAEALFVFSYAGGPSAAIECEAIARSDSTPPGDVKIITNLPGGSANPNYSLSALVSTPNIILTGTQAAPGTTDAEIRAMLDGLRSAVATAGGKLSNVVMASAFWTTTAVRDRVRVLRPEYYEGTVPASTGILFHGFRTATAGAALEAVIAIPGK